VSKVLHLYSDDMAKLQTCLGLGDKTHEASVVTG
jgi:hypothetical protein